MHEPGQRPYDLAERCWYTSGMILVVDHDPEVLEMAAKILNRDRQVFLATTAKQAFEILARLDGFSVVLVDLDLPGDPYALSSYQRARRFDTTAMAALTDGLVKLFSNDHLPLRALRDLGLSLVDRAPPVKRFLANKAAGPQ